MWIVLLRARPVSTIAVRANSCVVRRCRRLDQVRHELSHYFRGSALAYRFDFSSSSMLPAAHMSIEAGAFATFEMPPMEVRPHFGAPVAQVLTRRRGRRRDTPLDRSLVFGPYDGNQASFRLTFFLHIRSGFLHESFFGIVDSHRHASSRQNVVSFSLFFVCDRSCSLQLSCSFVNQHDGRSYVVQSSCKWLGQW